MDDKSRGKNPLKLKLPRLIHDGIDMFPVCLLTKNKHSENQLKSPWEQGSVSCFCFDSFVREESVYKKL